MTTARLTSITASFQRPFVLDGFEQPQPAGSYIVDIEEELLDPLLTPIWKRSCTAIRLRRHGAEEHVAIDPEQLEQGLIRDAAQQQPPTPLPRSAAEPRRHRVYSVLGRLPHRRRR